ncbi:hypothetical protein ASG36_16535 [Geodermatophilus sp. Leaf369]|uniref:FtsX-like permease family protein n=1 Tax=Geodermatophilus sp. Leaf369 TaxID=1736354 RepID=UPI00070123B5|nr:FtsX-like permease family protein [Geodermatophilus sp. Leaf369]KQS56671.1 hypothetical protein ASG36_16535 [Geodermatophilus sp. Leaf369]
MIARSRVQARLLVVVLVVLVAGLTVLGSCALLLTGGADRARQSSLAQAPADELAVEVVLTDLTADPLPDVSAAGDALTGALAPVLPRTSTWVTSTLRDLPPGADPRRLGWLAGVDDLTDRADLVAGSWAGAPTDGAPWPAVLPVAAAQALGLALGDTVTLEPSTGLDDAGDTAPVTVVLVGLVEPRADGGWDRDRLDGAGSVRDLEFGVFSRIRVPAAGPFLVDPAALLAAGAGVERVSLLAAPDVAAAAPAAVDRVAAGLAGLTRAVRATTDATSRVRAPLATTLAGTADRQADTRGAVLAVGLVVGLLTVAALGTAARVLGDRRLGETALLGTRGATRRQLVTRALPEAVVLVALGALVAVPLAVLVTRLLLADRLPGSDAGPLLPAGLLLPVLVVAVLLAVGLAVAATRVPAGGRSAGRGPVARSGTDLLLVGLAVVAVLGLGGATGADPLLVVAPALVLLAGAALLLRVPPLLAGAADRRAVRGRSLVPVLVAGDLARRPLASGAAALLVLATAAAVAATGVDATWRVSQADQADLRVGSDLAVPAVPGVDGDAVLAATGGTVSPVTEQPVSLGSVLGTGDDGAVPRLVAVDTAHAGEVLRGRLPDGDDWSSVTAGLVPSPARGIPGPGAVSVAGTVRGASVTATPTLVLADPTGARSTIEGAEVPLDGAPHEAGVSVPAGRSVVGVVLDLSLDGPVADEESTAPLTLDVTLPGAAPDWTATAPGEDGTITDPQLADDGLQLTGRVFPQGLTSGDARVVLAADPAPALLPVVLSAGLAADLGAAAGDRVGLTVGDAPVQAQVAGVVPDVPSVPGGPAVLTDVEALARAVLATGDLAPLTQAWWVGHPTTTDVPGAQSRAALTDQLRTGPLQVGLPTALGLLAAGAVALGVTGTVLQAAAVRSGRRAEVARLLGTGVPRRTVRAVLLLQHAVGTVLAVLLGAVVGVAGTVLVGPALTGAAVPEPTVALPWVPWALLVAGLAVVGTAVVLPAVRALLRVDVAGALREGAP